MQEKQQAVEEAAQAALEASSAAEAQHAAGAKQLAADKRSLQEQQDQVLYLHVSVPPCLPVFSDNAAVSSTSIAYSVSTCIPRADSSRAHNLMCPFRAENSEVGIFLSLHKCISAQFPLSQAQGEVKVDAQR